LNDESDVDDDGDNDDDSDGGMCRAFAVIPNKPLLLLPSIYNLVSVVFH